MSGGHNHRVDPTDRLDGPLDRVAPEVKVVVLVLWLVAVVVTPPRAVWAYGVHAAVVAGFAVVALVPPGTLVRRLVFEIPFVVLAAVIAVTGGSAGRWAAWAIVARATLGVAGVSVLAATTSPAELVAGFRRLRVPEVFTTVAAFTLRYVNVLRTELDRMRTAQLLRSPARVSRRRHARQLATVGAALFVRSYERGERAYDAMLARGLDGTPPAPAAPAGSPGQWFLALGIPTLAGTVTAIAVVTS